MEGHSCIPARRGSRISARGGRQGNDDLRYNMGWELRRFLTYANTDLQLFKMFIAILCLNGVEQPFKRHQVSLLSALEKREPCAFGAGPSVPGVGARPSAPLGPILPTCHHVRTSPFRRCDVPMAP